MSEINRQFDRASSQPKVLASIVANTYTYAIGRGVSASKIHALTGLLRINLLAPEARLPEEVVPLIWTLLCEAYPEQVLTLHMASGTPVSYFGALTQCVQYADTLRSALQTFVRYHAILADRLYLDLIESDTEGTLHSRHPLDAIDGGCSTEVTLAMLKRLVQSIIGVDDFLVRVELTHSPHKLPQAYDTFFGAAVYFRRPCNALVFHRAALDRPALQRDPHLFKYIQGNLDLQLRECGPTSKVSPLSALQHAIARNADGGEYTAEALAQQMNMSLRALQRLAKEQGLTIRQLLDEARAEKARRLLADSSLGVEAISAQLGYSDDRAFRRAFKRWTGQTPKAFRQQSI
ncbi:MAG: AraC family transcriptional regulator ligand-binding domain-containing protein [Cyanobacteria bacterium P01_F01_bin.86]